MHPEAHSHLPILPLLLGKAQLCSSLLPGAAQVWAGATTPPQRWKLGPAHWQGGGHAGKGNPRLQQAHCSMNSQDILLLQVPSTLRLTQIKVVSFIGQLKLARQVTGGTATRKQP